MLFVMIYVFGILGFFLGFCAGLVSVHQFLRHYSRQQLIKDKSLHWTYGLAVWLAGGVGAALGVWLYERSIL